MEISHYSCHLKYIPLPNGRMATGASGQQEVSRMLGSEYTVVAGVLDSHFGYMIRHETIDGLMRGVALLGGYCEEEAAA